MKRTILLALLVLCIVSSANAIEKRTYMMREDFGTQALSDCYLQYYYFVPCPTLSWFWGFSGWDCGTTIGTVFTIGDESMGSLGTAQPCDSINCYRFAELRVLDFAGYGISYPGLFTVEFDVYCADEFGCPVGGSLWNSGPQELARSWNYIAIASSLDISGCFVHTGEPPSKARFLVTATHTGTDCTFPEWGLDDISTLLEESCDMHDLSCLPVLYPRPTISHYPEMRSGFYGNNFEYCPPQRFQDGKDSTIDASLYGFIELAWRVRLVCDENAAEPTTWGSVKSLYR